jgi:spore germination cell wall hydrolase CwlJ-like protein
MEEMLVKLAIVISLANPSFTQKVKGYEMKKESHCLAMNMYHEARGESYKGMLAVSSVVLNRVADKRYPNSICGVIYQGSANPKVSNKCQFSWTCDKLPDKPKEKEFYRNIHLLAKQIMKNKESVKSITKYATHYHADYVNPFWANKKYRTIKINKHIFYKM